MLLATQRQAHRHAGCPAQLLLAQAAYRTRKKDSFRFIVAHIADKATLTLLSDVNGPYFQDGAAALDSAEVAGATRRQAFPGLGQRAVVVDGMSEDWAGGQMRASG